MKYVTYFF